MWRYKDQWWSVLSFLPSSPRKSTCSGSNSLWPAKVRNAWSCRKTPWDEWGLLVITKDHLRSPGVRQVLTWLKQSQAAPERAGLFPWSGRCWWAVEQGVGGRLPRTESLQSVSPVWYSLVNLMMPLWGISWFCTWLKVKEHGDFSLHSSNEEDTLFFFFERIFKGDFRAQMSKLTYSLWWPVTVFLFVCFICVHT